MRTMSGISSIPLKCGEFVHNLVTNGVQISGKTMIMNVNPKTIKLTVVSDPDALQHMTNGWEARVREMFICLLPSTSQTGSNNMSNEGDFCALILSAIVMSAYVLTSLKVWEEDYFIKFSWTQTSVLFSCFMYTFIFKVNTFIKEDK